VTEELAVGIIRAAHGVAGELRVRSYSGDFEHFARLSAAMARKGTAERRLEVLAARRRVPDVLLRVAGVEDREAAQRLVGWELWVGRQDAARLGDGEYYEADLCRCSLYFGSELIGPVRAVVEGGAVQMLEVTRPDGSSVLVPFQDRFVGAVDVAGGRISLREDDIVR
jgi:16S rRNA processing protein RimM